MLGACASETFEAFGTRFTTAAKAAVRSSGDAKYHEVRRGETLQSIADRYSVDVDRLARANGLKDTDRLQVRQRLRVPTGRFVHRVQPGETLSGIANRYRVRVSTIAHLNRLGISRQIEVGQRLLIPGKSTPPDVATAPPRTSAVRPPKPAAPVAPDVEKAPDPRLESARGLVDEAVADYRAARFDAGLARAREAEDVLRDLDGDRDARKLSARAAFVAGSAQAARGEEDQASESFARVRTLDPAFEPPPGWLSPRLAALYAEAQPD
jgi:LysM repeat protein